jgi:hypothetical protein
MQLQVVICETKWEGTLRDKAGFDEITLHPTAEFSIHPTVVTSREDSPKPKDQPPRDDAASLISDLT